MSAERDRAAFYQKHKDDPEVWGSLKKPRGRPSKGLKASITVRLTPQELDQIARSAAASGSTYSDFIRRSILAQCSESDPQHRPNIEGPATVGVTTSQGFPDIDDKLRTLPDRLQTFGAYEPLRGYKRWRVPGDRTNWFQWNDGGESLRICFPTHMHEPRTWKLFARFSPQRRPSEPWERPYPYRRDLAQWMPAGVDVWGCSYEGLRAYLQEHSVDELLNRLEQDLTESRTYAASKNERRRAAARHR